MGLGYHAGSQTFPTMLVRRLGHDRWKLENNGWNDVTQNWGLKHGFLHACRHRPHHDVDGMRAGSQPLLIGRRPDSVASLHSDGGLCALSLQAPSVSAHPA